MIKNQWGSCVLADNCVSLPVAPALPGKKYHSPDDSVDGAGVEEACEAGV